MPAPTLWTFQDAVDLILDYRNAAADERNQRRVRAAITAAYREFTQSRSWKFLATQGRLQLEGYYSTGTVEYDHTGGANERQLTLTTGTWPSWAANGTVRISSKNHRVASRVSNSVITLDTVNNPGADISSGTSYVLYQSAYYLPTDFRSMCPPLPESTWYYQQFIQPDEWMALERNQSTSGTPQKYTILGSADVYAQKQIGLWPYPDSDQTYDFLYQRYARPIRYSGYETNSKVGTVSCSASTSVTGSSTQFASGMVGSVIRFSTSSTLPDGEGGLNPYAEQRIITAVGSTTGITLDSATTGTYSGVAYTISDPIDIFPTMLDAFRWKVLMELDSLSGSDRLAVSSKRYREAFVLACEADADMEITRSPLGVPQRYGYWTVDMSNLSDVA